ncbi:pyridoxal phosphate-dependent aminotransferase [Piscirickettsia litoralis]|uniref:Aminotransferase n=1 Tax=Piscirickettsia litoralis TaxID=1891921 RepID=A0ABX3A353_9GAMM|nr:aminotransferase class I/II-fold pyridoxal phosphate-dependent enzyme [Piscirickettsia litoralis]ODN42873.1 hypothetical protein BGC07_07975 [Piscirickettsia litoralis]
MSIDIIPQVSTLKESATLAINQQAKTLRQQGQPVCHFGFGQSPFPVPDILQTALQEHADKKAYLPTQGLPELCSAISQFCQTHFDYNINPEQVFVGPGSKELLFQLLFLLEGDAFIPAPSWVSYGPQAKLLNKPVHYIQTQFKQRYCLQADEFEHALKNSNSPQNILILNSPNNPTGQIYSESNLKELAKVCKKYNVIVISDEIYSLTEYAGNSHQSITYYYPEKTIITNGLSKAFAAGGYRLGFTIIPTTMPKLHSALKIMISETYSAVSSPIQYAATILYNNSQQLTGHLKKCNSILRFISDYVSTRLKTIDINCWPGQGAFYLAANFNSYKEKLAKVNIHTSMDLCDHLLKHSHVACLPGCEFYLPKTELVLRLAIVDFDGEKLLKQLEHQEISAGLFPEIVAGCDRLEHFFNSL